MEFAEVVWSRLSALFGKQESFDRKFLRDLSDGAKGNILLHFKFWLDELEWPSTAAWSEAAKSTLKSAK
jgi:hypothetical protein